MLSMALCWLLGDPDRRAPKGLQYLVLLWQEDLPGEPLPKESYGLGSQCWTLELRQL